MKKIIYFLVGTTICLLSVGFVFFQKNNTYTGTLKNNFISTTASYNKSKPTFLSVKSDVQNGKEDYAVKYGGVKADDYYFEELIRSYETLLVEAINENSFFLIEDLLVPGSNLYKSQKKLVADLYNKKIKEKLIDFSIEKIVPSKNDDEYKAYVYEKIGIKYPNRQDYQSKEFYWIYNIVTEKDDPEKCKLSDIEKWIKNKK